MEVRQHSILETETAFVDVRTVAEIHIQVEKEEGDTMAVSSVGVGVQVSAGSGSAIVAALGADTDYAEGVVGENTPFVAIEDMYSAGSEGSRSRTVNWGYRPVFPSQRRDHGRAAVEGTVCRIVGVAAEGVVCMVAKVAVGLVGMVPRRTGEVTSQGLTNCTDSGKVAVAEVGRWWKPGEHS